MMCIKCFQLSLLMTLCEHPRLELHILVIISTKSFLDACYSHLKNLHPTCGCYLISLSSCCAIRLLQKFSRVTLAMVTRSLVWLLMEEHELWPVIAMLYLQGHTEDSGSILSVHTTGNTCSLTLLPCGLVRKRCSRQSVRDRTLEKTIKTLLLFKGQSNAVFRALS